MADGSTNCSPTRYGSRTICLPIGEQQYAEIVQDAAAFRRWLEEAFRQMPELFPDGFE